MKFLAAWVALSTSILCTGLSAQESRPDNAPSPVRAGSVPAPVATVPVPAVVLPSGPLGSAEMAATRWLAVVDAGDYPLSWRTAAALLQSSVTQAQWESALQTSRLPLGSVKSRTLKAASYSRTLPFAPDGDYVLMEYETRFEFKPQAIETLTTTKDRDNTWKVTGYFIK